MAILANNSLDLHPDRMKGAGQTRRIRSHVVYGGDDSQQGSDAQVLSWRHARRVVVDESWNTGLLEGWIWGIDNERDPRLKRNFAVVKALSLACSPVVC